MRYKRPLLLLIIFLNIFYIVNFFVGDKGIFIKDYYWDGAILEQFALLAIWLAIMNIVLYFLYWVLVKKKRR